jgi:hypothetical protein
MQVEETQLAYAMRAMQAHIEFLTGSKPPTCPWRVFYDPLVDKVVEAANAAKNNAIGVVLGDDPPAIILDGLRVYNTARSATEAHDFDEEKKRREAERKHKR